MTLWDQKNAAFCAVFDDTLGPKTPLLCDFGAIFGSFLSVFARLLRFFFAYFVCGFCAVFVWFCVVLCGVARLLAAIVYFL